MLAVWAERWPVVALRGVFAVLFGIIALVWPGATVLSLVMLFGAFILAQGILSGILAFTRQPPQPRWLLALEAVIGVIAGVVCLTQLGLATLTLVYVLGTYAVIAGVARIFQAVSLRKEIDNEWMLGLSGVLTTLLGVLILARPGAGALAMAWTLGIFAIAFGVAEISLGMRLRSLAMQAVPAGPRVWSMRAEEHPEVVSERERTKR